MILFYRILKFQEYAKILTHQAVAYINVDTAVQGTSMLFFQLYVVFKSYMSNIYFCLMLDFAQNDFYFLGNHTIELKSTPELVDVFFDAAKKVVNFSILMILVFKSYLHKQETVQAQNYFFFFEKHSVNIFINLVRNSLFSLKILIVLKTSTPRG